MNILHLTFKVTLGHRSSKAVMAWDQLEETLEKLPPGDLG